MNRLLILSLIVFYYSTRNHGAFSQTDFQWMRFRESNHITFLLKKIGGSHPSTNVYSSSSESNFLWRHALFWLLLGNHKRRTSKKLPTSRDANTRWYCIDLSTYVKLMITVTMEWLPRIDLIDWNILLVRFRAVAVMVDIKIRFSWTFLESTLWY